MTTKTLEAQIENSQNAVATKIAIANGDGIGPEIMNATLKIMEAAGANIEPQFIKLGKEVYLSGETSGIASDSWDTIDDCRVIFKAPITTPQGKGYKSLNVTLRKTLGLFANVRPVKALDPFVNTGHPNMEVVIIRENEEDLYAGIEHRQTTDVVQCLKLITRPGCEKIIRYAFDYAIAHNRKKVTCLVKDNIMKLTDGLFANVFREIAAEYPTIESKTQIIDIGSAKLAAHPEQFDVVVTSNLYGDIVSDIVAEVAGSVGLAGSANIGSSIAMFEAIHGSAPDISGKGIANPSGLLNAGVMMLNHIGQPAVAKKIKNAWLATIEDGIHTADIFQEGWSTQLVGTQEFADAVIERLGDTPSKLKPYEGMVADRINTNYEYKREAVQKTLVGTDIFIDWQGSNPNQIGGDLASIKNDNIKLKMITNRGVKVFPNGSQHTYCTDHWRCRFVSKDGGELSPQQLLDLMSQVINIGHDIIKTENLYQFDGQIGYSLGQGE